MNEKAIELTVESLRWNYGIIVALSIGEAFKQFLLPSDDADMSGIQWKTASIS